MLFSRGKSRKESRYRLVSAKRGAYNQAATTRALKIMKVEGTWHQKARLVVITQQSHRHNKK